MPCSLVGGGGYPLMGGGVLPWHGRPPPAEMRIGAGPGTAVSPPGHMLLVQWARKPPEGEDGKDQEPEPLPRDKAAV